MNIKKTSLLFALITILAAEKIESNVVTTSGQKIVTESKIGQELNEKLQKEKERLSKPLQEDEKVIIEKEKVLQEKKKEIDKEAEEISNSKLYSPEAKQKKFDELQEKARRLEEDKAELERLIKRLQADAKRLEAKMTQMYQEEMGKFDGLIKETIKSVANKEGWDVVLMEEAVVYANPAVSKTDFIIKELDAKFKTPSKQ